MKQDYFWGYILLLLYILFNSILFLSPHTSSPHPTLHRSFVSRSFVIFFLEVFAGGKTKSSLKPSALQVFCKSVTPGKRREERDTCLGQTQEGFWNTMKFITTLEAQGRAYLRGDWGIQDDGIPRYPTQAKMPISHRRECYCTLGDHMT